MIPPNWKSRPGIISMMLFSKETFVTLMRKSVDPVQNLKDPSMSFVFQAKNLKDPIMSVAISDQVRRHDLWNWHLEARATWPWTNCLSACVVHASHDTCHDYLVIFWGKSPAILQNAHGREKMFISMRGLRFTGRTLWQLVYFLAHVIDESEKCPMFVNKMCTRLLFDASHASRS